jgi:hypothetical protein
MFDDLYNNQVASIETNTDAVPVRCQADRVKGKLALSHQIRGLRARGGKQKKILIVMAVINADDDPIAERG